MVRNFKVLLAVLAVMIIAGSAYAFAAANVVPDTNAGYVASVVSGYTVGNIVYDLDATDPTLVDAITFDINPTTGTNKALLVMVQTATGGAWTTCTLVDGTLPEVQVTCTYGALALSSVTALNVVASDSLNP
jgi:hypothetical protein